MKLLSNIGTRVAEAYAYRREPERLYVLAESYWRALLCTAALIVVCGIAYGTFQLVAVLAGSGDAGIIPLSSGREATFNRAQLQATLDGFTARQTNYSLLKANPPRVADPSR